MVNEAYVSLEVAKLFKEKGFDIECNTAYYNDNLIDYTMYGFCGDEELIFAPTHQMAIKWLREEKNILIYVYPVINLPVKDDYTFYWRWDGKKKIHYAPRIGDKHNYETFEDAVEAALKYCLQNLI